MAKPKNFPERKRQRRLGALARNAPMTAGKPAKGIAPKSNNQVVARLQPLQRTGLDVEGVGRELQGTRGGEGGGEGHGARVS